jgi:threonyl-tRNA synthetase
VLGPMKRKPRTCMKTPLFFVALCRWDLCAGPHVEKTSDLNMDAIKLESVAGAYWRGDENRAMLQVGLRV